MNQTFFNETSETELKNYFHQQVKPYLKKQSRRFGRPEVILGINQWKVKKVKSNLVVIFKNNAENTLLETAWVKRFEFSKPDELTETKPLNISEWICLIKKIS